MKKDLRKQFFNCLIDLASKDNDIILLVGDLGYSFIEDFATKYPDKYINCGIAEQNMIGLAIGLSLAGKKPYCYSGSIFITMRPYEQIRNAAYNNANIKIFGTKASPFLGFSHNLKGRENEIKLLSFLPNIKCYKPKREWQLRRIMQKENERKGLSYTRI